MAKKKKEETTLNGETTEVAGVRELSDSELDSVIGGAWVELIDKTKSNVCYYKPLDNGLYALVKTEVPVYTANQDLGNATKDGYTLGKNDLVYVRTENGVDLYGWPQ